MKGLRTIPKILKINEIDGYKVSLLFSNGENRVVDFYDLLNNQFALKPGRVGFELLTDSELFGKIKLSGNTIGWETIGLHSRDESGNEVFYPYELDPLVLYAHSQPDPRRNIQIGEKILEARKAAGLTQEELARRSGTTKHYISRLENNKTDIELLTLRKIVEAGLGRRLDISIR